MQTTSHKFIKFYQFGDTLEIHEYEKSPTPHLPTPTEPNKNSDSIKSSFSKQRTISTFFRLVHHNNYIADSVDFITLTFAVDYDYRDALKQLSTFFQRFKRTYKFNLKYINVPEYTKKGRVHFHLLVYNLPHEISHTERETRNLQRLYQRGYLDIRHTSNRSPKIAQYMAKYLSKSITDKTIKHKRFFNTSRNIDKPTIQISNQNTINSITNKYNYQLKQQHKIATTYLGLCTIYKYTTTATNIHYSSLK